MSTVVDAPFDAYLDTPNKSPRQDVPRKGVCLHHGALTSLDYLEYLAMGGKQVSATAIVKDRVSKRLMTDEFRAWSLSSAWGDSSFRSVETCNESTDGWTISDESHWELAHLVAYWALVDGFWPHRDGDLETWTVVGHREMYTIWGVSYATACPGGMDLDLVTARAQSILRGTAPAGLGFDRITNQEEDADMEAFIKAPNGTILHLIPGVKFAFESQKQYEKFRGDQNFLLQKGFARGITPPPLSDVPGVSWETYTIMCNLYGVTP